MPAKLLYRDAQGRDAAVNLPETGSFLGRAVDCIIRTDDAMVSRKNCKISFINARWYVEDLGSANGTMVNDTTIGEATTLQSGDRIMIGQVGFYFVADGKDLPPVQLEPSMSTTLRPADRIRPPVDENEFQQELAAGESAPAEPVAPVAPVAPCGPTEPAVPVSPLRPWLPVSPVSPLLPLAPKVSLAPKKDAIS